jgi:alpha-L-fucosidase
LAEQSRFSSNLESNSMQNNQTPSPAAPSQRSNRPIIKKLGTLDLGIVETTPVIWKNRLLRFELIHSDYRTNSAARNHYRFVDFETNQTSLPFAWDYSYGSAHVEKDTMFVFATRQGGKGEMDVLWSTDLQHWEARTALSLPGWGLYNQSVCRGDGRYVMAFEVGEPAEMVGVRFTNFFAESSDLFTWRVLPPEDHVFARDRYTACPVIRYLDDGFYYMIYLECIPLFPLKPRPEWRTEDCTFESHIVRTRDFIQWENSPFNPVLQGSQEDRHPAHYGFTEEQQKKIARAVNRNNSDVDLCEWNGQTVVLYSWGAQTGTEFLAHARFDGSLKRFLTGFFP